MAPDAPSKASFPRDSDYYPEVLGQVLGQYRERVGDVHRVHVGQVGDAATPNRFRYWDLKEAVSKLHVMGFQCADCVGEIDI